MSAGVEVKQFEAKNTAYVIARGTFDNIRPIMGEAMQASRSYIESLGDGLVGAQYTRVLSTSESGFEFEVGYLVKSPVPGDGRVQGGELPAATVATYWHIGDYENLAESWAVLEGWFKDNGRQLADHAFEIYWTTAEDLNDLSTQTTEIHWPVA